MKRKQKRWDVTTERLKRVLDYIARHPRCRAKEIKASLCITESQWRSVAGLVHSNDGIRVECVKGVNGGLAYRVYVAEKSERRRAFIPLMWGWCASEAVLT